NEAGEMYNSVAVDRLGIGTPRPLDDLFWIDDGVDVQGTLRVPQVNADHYCNTISDFVDDGSSAPVGECFPSRLIGAETLADSESRCGSLLNPMPIAGIRNGRVVCPDRLPGNLLENFQCPEGQ